MSLLLNQSFFDSYLLESAVITTFNSFSIDGRIHKDFYPKEEKDSITDSFSRFSVIRPICLSLIRGKNTPLAFNLILHFPTESHKLFLNELTDSFNVSDIRAFVLSLKYDGSFVYCTTGTSLNTFTLDKSLDQRWDSYIPELLQSASISFEIL